MSLLQLILPLGTAIPTWLRGNPAEDIFHDDLPVGACILSLEGGEARPKPCEGIEVKLHDGDWRLAFPIEDVLAIRAYLKKDVCEILWRNPEGCLPCQRNTGALLSTDENSDGQEVRAYRCQRCGFEWTYTWTGKGWETHYPSKVC